MCGLIGISSKHPKNSVTDRSKFIKQALIMDSLRGVDGTGIIAVPENPKVLTHTHKRAIPGWDFVETHAAKNLIGPNIREYNTIIGHNRAATVGAITDSTAHPFVAGHISLVHNGTLKYNHGLPGDFDVDSEHIPHSMADIGELATLSKLNGAFALVWYNSQNNTLNFARNDERPLSLGLAADMKTLVWASELPMLKALCDRNALLNTNMTFSSLKAGRWVSFDLGADTFETYTATEFKIFKPEPYVYTTYTAATTKKNVTAHGGGNVVGIGAKKQLPGQKDSVLERYKLSSGDLIYANVFGIDNIVTSKTHSLLLASSNIPGVLRIQMQMPSNEAFAALGDEDKHGYAKVITGYTDKRTNKDIIICKEFAPVCNDAESKDPANNWMFHLPSWDPEEVDDTDIDIDLLELADNLGDEEETANALEYYPGPDGTVVSFDVMHQACIDGCTSCGDIIEIAEYEEAQMWADGKVICGYCVMEDDARQFNLPKVL